MTSAGAVEADRGTIYVDVTELVVLDLRTGIQRVVREILRHGMEGAADGEIIPVVAVGSDFHRLSAAGWQRIVAPGTGVAERRITHERGVHPLVRLGKRLAKVSAGFYNKLQGLYVRRLLRKRALGLYEPELLPVGAGSLLVLLDSFWGGSSTLAAAGRARRAGASIVLVVYDLIPISHPQFSDDMLVRKYRPLMARAAAASDRILVISQACGEAFRREFPGTSPVSFPLGHDLHEGDAGASLAWPEQLWNGDGPIFVVVGSIEPRKGHAAVLDAFERRWQRRARDKLLVIGKVGWNVDALMSRLDHHQEAGRRLFHVHNATDAMLKDALQRAYAAIIASYIEGFGLPLVESLAAGLPVLASDIPVFREIAGDSVLYFEAGNPAALDAAMDLLCERYDEMSRKAAAFTWPDWRAAAEDFYGKLTTDSPA